MVLHINVSSVNYTCFIMATHHKDDIKIMDQMLSKWKKQIFQIGRLEQGALLRYQVCEKKAKMKTLRR
jgi:hypothetical protein